jgi:hypothetical protein
LPGLYLDFWFALELTFFVLLFVLSGTSGEAQFNGTLMWKKIITLDQQELILTGPLGRTV